jgi:sulfoxide reductase heme-binding subunit YedZ
LSVDALLATVDLTAVDLSSMIGLTAIGLLTANILMGLLVSVGYNPVRRWPRKRIKLFKLHNWTGYTALGVVLLHPIVLLCSRTAGFRLIDIALPLWSPTQPFENTLGALALYLVIVAVVTSYFRHQIGFHRWKLLHFVTYAAAATFFVHALLTDPELKNRPVDWIDAEKVFIEMGLLLVAGATAWRYRWARTRHHLHPQPPIRPHGRHA